MGQWHFSLPYFDPEMIDVPAKIREDELNDPGIIVPMPAASVPNASARTSSHTAPDSPIAGAVDFFEQHDDLFVLG
jgi:hypothetical protein